MRATSHFLVFNWFITPRICLFYCKEPISLRSNLQTISNSHWTRTNFSISRLTSTQRDQISKFWSSSNKVGIRHFVECVLNNIIVALKKGTHYRRFGFVLQAKPEISFAIFLFLLFKSAFSSVHVWLSFFSLSSWCVSLSICLSLFRNLCVGLFMKRYNL